MGNRAYPHGGEAWPETGLLCNSQLPEGPQTSHLQASVSSRERKLLRTSSRKLNQTVQRPQPASTAGQAAIVLPRQALLLIPCGFPQVAQLRRRHQKRHTTPDGVSDWEPTDFSSSGGVAYWIPGHSWKLQTPAGSADPCQPAASLLQLRT